MKEYSLIPVLSNGCVCCQSWCYLRWPFWIFLHGFHITWILIGDYLAVLTAVISVVYPHRLGYYQSIPDAGGVKVVDPCRWGPRVISHLRFMNLLSKSCENMSSFYRKWVRSNKYFHQISIMISKILCEMGLRNPVRLLELHFFNQIPLFFQYI